jgi:hypothetical protein
MAEALLFYRHTHPPCDIRTPAGKRIPKHIDKSKKDRGQYIPAALMERLAAFAEAGEAEAIYERTYRQQDEALRRYCRPLTFPRARAAS